MGRKESTNTKNLHSHPSSRWRLPAFSIWSSPAVLQSSKDLAAGLDKNVSKKSKFFWQKSWQGQFPRRRRRFDSRDSSPVPCLRLSRQYQFQSVTWSCYWKSFCASVFPQSHPGNSAPSTCTSLHTALPLHLQKYVFLWMSPDILERVDDGKMTASRSWEPFGSIPLPSYCCDPKPLHHWPVGTGKATEAPVGLWKGP